MSINYIFNAGLTNLINDVSFSSIISGDNSNSIIDSSLNTFSSTETGTGQIVDISVNNVDLSSIQSIVVYNNDNIGNPIISKIRYETIENVSIDVNEIQVWRDNSNIIDSVFTLSTLPAGYQFNKVKLVRTSGSHHTHVSELQIWINGTNVAPSATVTSSGDGTWSGWGGKEKINDEQHLNGSQGWHTNTDGTGKYIQLALSTKYNINDLESIVLYNRQSPQSAQIPGVSIQLYEDNSLKYTSEISVVALRYRFDGPSITNVASFSTGISTTQIISSSAANVTVIKDPDLTIQVSSNGSTKNNIVDSSNNTSYQSTQGIGQYIDINLSPTNLNDIQSIVVYNNTSSSNDLSNQKATKLTLYDDNNVEQFIINNNQATDTSYNYFKYKGTSQYVDQIQRIKLETTNQSTLNLNEMQLWIDGSNVLQQSNINSLTTSSTTSIKVARLRRESDNLEADFYNENNNGLKLVDGTTLDSWSFILTKPTYDWNFRIDSGTSITDSIAELTATYNGGLTSSTTNGATLDGSNDYISLPTFQFGGTFSIEVYFRITAGQSDWTRIFQFSKSGIAGGLNHTFNLSKYINNNYFTIQSFGSNADLLLPKALIQNNVWTHMVITMNGSTLKAYYNGDLVGYKTTADPQTNTTRDTNYLFTDSGSKMPGNIKYFRYWHGSELTRENVNTLYANRETTNAYSQNIYLTKLYSQSTLTTSDLIQTDLSRQPLINTSTLDMVFNGSQDIYAEDATKLLNDNQDNFSFAFTFNHQSESNHGEMGFWPTVGAYNEGGSVSFYGQQASGNKTNIGFEGYDNGTGYNSGATVVDINTEYNFIMTINNSNSNNILSWANNSTTTPTTTAASSGNGGNNTTHSLNPDNFYLGSRLSTGIFYIGTLKSFSVFNKTLSTTEAAAFNSSSNYTANNSTWINTNNLESSMTAGYSLYNLNSNANLNNTRESVIYDRNLQTSLNITDKGVSKFIDLSLNNSYDVSLLDALVLYSDNNIYNPTIKKIRYETTTNNILQLNELQVWVDNSNILADQITSVTQSSNVTDLSYAYDGNFDTSASTNSGIGEYFEFNLSGFTYNSLQSIVAHIGDSSNNKLTLYDDSDIAVIETDITSSQINVMKFKGPDHDSSIRKLRNFRLITEKYSKIKIDELQLWYNGANILSSWNMSVPLPTHYWDFRVNSSSTITDIIGGLTATLNGGSVANSIDGAVLDGVNDYIDLQSFPYGNDFTFEWYMYVENTVQNGDCILKFSKSTSGSEDPYLNIIYNGNTSKFRITDQNSGTSGRLINGWEAGPLTVESWLHIVLVVNQTSNIAQFYINGSQSGGNRSINSASNGIKEYNYYNLGRSSHGGAHLASSWKYFRVWQGTSLTSSQITELYNERNNDKSTGIFNSYYASSGTDISGNIFDRNFDTSASTEFGTGEYIDVSLNTPINYDEVESLVVYSSKFENTNQTVSKLRYGTVGNINLELNDIQLWVNNRNIFYDFSFNIIKLERTSGYNWMYLNELQVWTDKVKVARLRRSSDNAEADFFNNGNNNLTQSNGENLITWLNSYVKNIRLLNNSTNEVIIGEVQLWSNGNNVAVDSNVTFDPSNSQTYINDYDPLNIVDQKLPLYSNTTVGEGANGGGRSKMRGGAGGGGDGGENTGGGGGTGGRQITASGGRTGYAGYGGSGGSGIVIITYTEVAGGTITISNLKYTYGTTTNPRFPGDGSLDKSIYFRGGSGSLIISHNITGIYVVGGGAGGSNSSTSTTLGGGGGGVSFNSVNLTGSNTLNIAVGEGGTGTNNGNASTVIVNGTTYTGNAGTINGNTIGTQNPYNSLYYGGSGGGTDQNGYLGGGGGSGGRSGVYGGWSTRTAGSNGGGISSSLTGGSGGAEGYQAGGGNNNGGTGGAGGKSYYGGGGAGGGGAPSSSSKNGGYGGQGGIGKNHTYSHALGYINLELFNQIDPTSIESIVIYNILSNAHRLNGVNIQLLNSNLDILYESPVVSGITDIGDTDSAVTISGIRIRFDGPKINDATFTTGNNSTTSIVNANFTSLGNIFNYETNTTYVTKLYNQSSIRNTPLIQTSLSNQPIIDLSDLKINFNGSTSFMYAETSTDLLDSGDDTYSYATTASSTGSTSGNLMGFSANVNNTRSNLYFSGGTNVRFVGHGNDGQNISVTSNESNYLLTMDNNLSSNNKKIWINNSNTTATGTQTTNNPSALNLDNSNFYIGQLHVNHNNYEKFTGTAKSFFVFNKTLSTTEAAAFNSTNNYSSNVTPWVNQYNLEEFMTGAYSLFNLNKNFNVAHSSTAGGNNLAGSSYLPSKAIDANLSSEWRTDILGKDSGEHLQITLPDMYSINDIASIVLYNKTDVTKDRILGCSFKLFKDDELQYNFNIDTAVESYRFDGPKIRNISTFISSRNNYGIIGTNVTTNVIRNNEIYATSNINDVSNILDQNKETYYNSTQGSGQYIDISFNSFSLSDLQEIVIFNYGNSGNDLSNQNMTELILFDNSDVPVSTFINQSSNDNYNIYKYKGPAHQSSVDKINKIRIETTEDSHLNIDELQVWVDQSDIMQSYNFTYSESSKFTSNFITVGGENLLSDGTSSIIAFTASSQHTSSYSASNLMYNNSDVSSTWIAASNTYNQGYAVNNRLGNNHAPGEYVRAEVAVPFKPSSFNIHGYNHDLLRNNFHIPAHMTIYGSNIAYETNNNIIMDTLHVTDNVGLIFQDANDASNSVNTYSATSNYYKYFYFVVPQTNKVGQSDSFSVKIKYIDMSGEAYVNLADSNFNTMSKTNKGVGEYFDISFNQSFDVSKLESLVIYSEPDNSTDYLINKIRYETTGNVRIELNEIQVWIDNSNIFQNGAYTAYSTSSNDNVINLFDLSSTSKLVTDQGIGQYIDISFNNAFNYSDLQYLITYNLDPSQSDLSHQYETAITFYQTETPVVHKNLYEFGFSPAITNVNGGTHNGNLFLGKDYASNFGNINTVSSVSDIIVVSGIQSGKWGGPEAPFTSIHRLNGSLSNWIMGRLINGVTKMNQVTVSVVDNYPRAQNTAAGYITGDYTTSSDTLNSGWTNRTTTYTAYDDRTDGYAVTDLHIRTLINKDKNIIKHRGPNHESGIRKIKKIRFDVSEFGHIKIDEMQVWSKNNNVFNKNNTRAPTYSFILNGIHRSLTSLYSSNTLTLVNSPTFTNDGVYLDGINQYITIPQSIGNFGNDDFTVSLWIKYSVIEKTTVFSFGYNSNDSIWYGTFDSTLQFGLVDMTGSSVTIYHSSTSPSTTTVQNHVITKSGNTVKVFIDGVQKINFNRTNSLPTSDYHVGYPVPRGADGGVLNGIIYRIDIWKGIGFSS